MDWNVKQTIAAVGLVLLLVGGSALAGQALTRQFNSEHESSASYPESRQADTARPKTPHRETEPDSGASSTTVATPGELEGPHPVESVVDGDTIRIRRQGGVEALRLIGIDSPEVDSPYTEAECFGEAASERARELLEGKEVYIANGTQTDDRDRYNRLLRYVYLDENTHVNQLLIESGHAREYTYDGVYAYRNAFRRAEARARHRGAGLWAENGCRGRTEEPATGDPGPDERSIDGCISYTKAPERIGTRTCVTGIVDHTYTSATDTTFINFCEDYRECPFSSVVFQDDRHRFTNTSDWEGRQVAIEGRIDTYEGRPQIVLDHPSQVRLVE